MIKTNSFTDKKRKVKLNKLGNVAWVLERHVGFIAHTDFPQVW
jgi:hypothetical protein